jgi:hypothetical protein
LKSQRLKKFAHHHEDEDVALGRQKSQYACGVKKSDLAVLRHESSPFVAVSSMDQRRVKRRPNSFAPKSNALCAVDLAGITRVHEGDSLRTIAP